MVMFGVAPPVELKGALAVTPVTPPLFEAQVQLAPVDCHTWPFAHAPSEIVVPVMAIPAPAEYVPPDDGVAQPHPVAPYWSTWPEEQVGRIAAPLHFRELSMTRVPPTEI